MGLNQSRPCRHRNKANRIMSRTIHLFRWNYDNQEWENAETEERWRDPFWLLIGAESDRPVTFHPNWQSAMAALALDQQQPEPK